MAHAIEFKDQDHLIQELKRQGKYLAAWFRPNKTTICEIVLSSVGSNTFRAFHKMPQKPSKVFRAWGSSRLHDPKTRHALMSCKSQPAYDQWLRRFSEDFRGYWSREMGATGAISYGPARKLPNLLLKGFVRWEDLSDKDRNRLIRFLHVPLDNYSLAAIRNCIPGEYQKIVGRIPSGVTMSFVTKEDQYDQIQEIIRALANDAKVPPIYLDVLAWDRAH